MPSTERTYYEADELRAFVRRALVDDAALVAEILGASDCGESNRTASQASNVFTSTVSAMASSIRVPERRRRAAKNPPRLPQRI